LSYATIVPYTDELVKNFLMQRMPRSKKLLSMPITSFIPGLMHLLRVRVAVMNKAAAILRKSKKDYATPLPSKSEK
jgi:hypothetical protein